MHFSAVKYSIAHHAAIIELPDDTAPVLFQTIASELSQALSSAQKNTALKVVVLKSQSDNWYSGLGEKNISAISKFDFSQNLRDSSELIKLYQQIYTLRKPVVAIVHGEAFSLSCGIIAACDFIFAAHETARFGFPDVQYGIFPAAALFFVVKRIGEAKAREIILRNSILTADEAYNYGLVNVVVPAIELEKTSNSFIERLSSSNSSTAIGLLKELLFRVQGMSVADALEYAANLNALSRMTDEFKKGIEFLTKKS